MGHPSKPNPVQSPRRLSHHGWFHPAPMIQGSSSPENRSREAFEREQRSVIEYAKKNALYQNFSDVPSSYSSLPNPIGGKQVRLARNTAKANAFEISSEEKKTIQILTQIENPDAPTKLPRKLKKAMKKAAEVEARKAKSL